MTYLCHSAPKVDPIRLSLLHKNLISILGSSPESGILRARNVRSPVALYDDKYACVASNPASLAASPDSTDPPLPPFVRAEFHCTCTPPEEELLVDSCFDRSDSEAVGHENGDEPVRLDAGDVGNDDGREVEATLNPFQAWLA